MNRKRKYIKMNNFACSMYSILAQINHGKDRNKSEWFYEMAMFYDDKLFQMGH